MKLAQSKTKLAASGQDWVEHFPAGTIKTIGALEIAGALGLVLPAALNAATFLAPTAATGPFLLMIGAAITHPPPRNPRHHHQYHPQHSHGRPRHCQIRSLQPLSSHSPTLQKADRPTRKCLPAIISEDGLLPPHLGGRGYRECGLFEYRNGVAPTRRWEPVSSGPKRSVVWREGWGCTEPGHTAT